MISEYCVKSVQSYVAVSAAVGRYQGDCICESKFNCCCIHYHADKSILVSGGGKLVFNYVFLQKICQQKVQLCLCCQVFSEGAPSLQSLTQIGFPKFTSWFEDARRISVLEFQ